MEYFMLAVSVVLPLLIYMLVGTLIKYLRIFEEETFKAVNRMIFRIMIPLAVFFSVYRADLERAVKPGLYAYVWISVVVVFALLYALCRKTKLAPPAAATMVQGMYRSNFVLFGVTIAASLCDGEGTATIAALTAIVVPTFNILAVIMFENARGEKAPAGRLLIEIFKNPLVDAGLLGLLAGLFHIRLPDLLAAALARLVFVPLVTVVTSILLGFRGNDLVAVLAAFASPTAVASTPMAQAMGGDGKLAGEIVAVTSVGCILTIFLWVFVLSGLGYL